MIIQQVGLKVLLYPLKMGVAFRMYKLAFTSLKDALIPFVKIG